MFADEEDLFGEDEYYDEDFDEPFDDSFDELY